MVDERWVAFVTVLTIESQETNEHAIPTKESNRGMMG